MKRGLELEYWVIDEEGALTPPSRALAEPSFVEREAHPCLIELRTDPQPSLSALRTQVHDRLDRLIAVARDDGRRLAPVGTALDGVDRDCRRTERIGAQRQLLGSAFDHALACAGTHVHFEQVGGDRADEQVESGRTGVESVRAEVASTQAGARASGTATAAQLNALLAVDPAFALVNTTPYSDGRRIATCARPYVYRRRCYRAYPTLGQLWRYARSADEWRERLRRSYQRFRQAATAAGVSEQVVEGAFEAATAVWGPVRLRDDLSTVEWRAPDATLPSQAIQLVADVSRVVRRAVAAEESGAATEPAIEDSDEALPGARGVDFPSFSRLQQLTDAAMARGLTDQSVRQYLARLGFDRDAYDSLGAQIDGQPRISSTRARQIRRRVADRLEDDVAALREVPLPSDEPEHGDRKPGISPRRQPTQ